MINQNQTWLEESEPQTDLQAGWPAFVAWADPTPWYQIPLLWLAYRAGTFRRWLRQDAS